KMDAKAAFNKDQSIRQWASNHGGVYIEVSPSVEPSPYLGHMEERDITTPSGKKLTLVNPATMLKQIMNDYAELYGVKGMIVSTAPLNPENMANKWEASAIAKIKAGAKEVGDFFIDANGKEFFHLIRPMVASDDCLHCHGAQGYKVGDVIGGVGVSIPTKKYHDEVGKIIWGNVITHGLIFITGIAGLFSWHTINSRNFKKQLQAERDLKESNDRFALFTRYSPNKIHIKDIKGRYTMLNPKSEELFGVSNKEAIGKTAREIFPSEDGLSFVKHDMDVIKNDSAIELEETFGNGANARTFLTVKFPIHDARGNIVSVGSSGVDITERKLAEAELVAIKHNLENLVKQRTRDLTEEVIERKRSVYELERRNETIEFLNKITLLASDAYNIEQGISDCLFALCDYITWPIGHVYLVSPTDPDMLIPSDEWYLEDPEFFKKFREITMKTNFAKGIGSPGRVLQSGEPLWIDDVGADKNFPRARMGIDIKVKSSLAIPIKVHGNVVAVMEFFTPFEQSLDQDLLRTIVYAGSQIGRLFERKKIEWDLREARDSADAANKAKSVFLSSMSHELRTPLNAIIGFSDFLMNHPTNPLDDTQSKYMKDVSDSGHHLLNLINEILDLSKIESGKDDLQIENVDLAKSCVECFSIAQALINDSGIKLKYPNMKNENRIIRADSKRFKQVLINLLSNAIKYNRKNGEVIVDFATTSDGMVKISVTDTGYGIPENKMDDLFKPFSRLGAEGSNIEGTGIGLVVTKKLVHVMGGQIGVDSEEGNGSTFWVSLPLA
ncbi:MAG: ATP-binding protein, partial [Rhodospirillaceae bacterium]|nr:ATP-binding protein [Rhodospirillaceae bacterium]